MTTGEATERQLQALLQISKVLHSTQQPAKLFRIAVASFIEFAGAERGFLVLRQADNSLEFTVALSSAGGDLAQEQFRISNSVVAEVFEHGEPIDYDLAANPQLKAGGSVEELDLKRVVCFPIRRPGPRAEGSRNPVDGVLYADSSLSTPGPSAAGADLLQALASQIGITLENVRLRKELLSEHEALQRTVQRKFRYEFIVGESEKMQAVYRMMDQISPTDVSVLITGETGTGKELVAKSIHYASQRGKGPFKSINCSALPENLVESELFGVERNVATGVSPRKGKFEQAHRGTLFLDEIGDMTMPNQLKLLRALQEGHLERVGGRQAIEADVRILASTNKDLPEAIRQRAFRQDLYYRLNVVTVHLPPLRDRGDDLDVLADHFFEQFCKLYRAELRGFSPQARSVMRKYRWPGNVRELEHRVKRAVILSDGPLILPADMEFDESTRVEGGSLNQAKKRLEIRYIQRALEQHQGNVSHSAITLGIGRRTLQNLMKKYRIERSPFRGGKGEREE